MFRSSYNKYNTQRLKKIHSNEYIEQKDVADAKQLIRQLTIQVTSHLLSSIQSEGEYTIPVARLAYDNSSKRTGSTEHDTPPGQSRITV